MIPVTALGASTIKIEALLDPDISIKVDGEQIQFDNAPLVVDGTTYIPLRELGEKVMDMIVEWDQDSKTISLRSSVRYNTLTAEQIAHQEEFRHALLEGRAEFFDFEAELDVEQIKELLARIDAEIHHDQAYLAEAEKGDDPEKYPSYLNVIVMVALDQLQLAKEYWEERLAELEAQPTE